MNFLLPDVHQPRAFWKPRKVRGPQALPKSQQREFTVNLIPKLRPEARESRAELALAAPGFWCHDIGICRATTIKRANTNALILIL